MLHVSVTGSYARRCRRGLERPTAKTFPFASSVAEAGDPKILLKLAVGPPLSLAGSYRSALSRKLNLPYKRPRHAPREENPPVFEKRSRVV